MHREWEVVQIVVAELPPLLQPVVAQRLRLMRVHVVERVAQFLMKQSL